LTFLWLLSLRQGKESNNIAGGDAKPSLRQNKESDKNPACHAKK
jgi:hypothetical protein